MTETDKYVEGYNRGREDERQARDLSDTQAMMTASPPKEVGLFKTPDITPAQLVAVVGACIAAAAAFGFDLTDSQQDSILQLVAVLGSVLLVGDAAIRHGRATGSAKKDGS